MHRALILLFSLQLIFAALPVAAADNMTRIPILVELFTSEGCSDCPPADAFLQKLDEQPSPGTEFVVLSEHVDYWNHDGWKDPYSSSSYTERQTVYVHIFDLPSAYTPQMVVDGAAQFVGSDQRAASKAFSNAATAPKVEVRLSSMSIEPANTLRAHIETAALPQGQKGEVYAAIALNHAENQVSRGENAGRKISHSSVARVLTKVGTVEKNQPFARDLQLKLPTAYRPGDLRLLAFIQQPHQGKVLGAAMQPLPSQ